MLDICGIDDNNIWAVGGITMAEGGTAIIKWDGIKWNFHPHPEGGANRIFGFTENDIWIVGGGTYGYSAHWNGTSWEEHSFFHPPQDTV